MPCSRNENSRTEVISKKSSGDSCQGLPEDAATRGEKVVDKQPEVPRAPSCDGISTVLLLSGSAVLNQFPDVLEQLEQCDE